MVEKIKAVGDRMASWLRTAVPVAWGVGIAWLVTRVPALEQWLNHPAVVGLGELLATAVVTVVWYPLWRWAEPRIPDWLTTLVLGYAKEPTYGGLPPIEGRVYGVADEELDSWKED